jgi:hypothetical protein
MPIKENLGSLGLQSAASNLTPPHLSGTKTELHQLHWTLDAKSVSFPPKCTILPQSCWGAPTPHWACPLHSIIHWGAPTPPHWGAPTPIRARPPPLGRAHPLWGAPTPIDHHLGRLFTQPGPAANMCPYCLGSETSSEECVHFS